MCALDNAVLTESPYKRRFATPGRFRAPCGSLLASISAVGAYILTKHSFKATAAANTNSLHQRSLRARAGRVHFGATRLINGQVTSLLGESEPHCCEGTPLPTHQRVSLACLHSSSLNLSPQRCSCASKRIVPRPLPNLFQPNVEHQTSQDAGHVHAERSVAAQPRR